MKSFNVLTGVLLLTVVSRAQNGEDAEDVPNDSPPANETKPVEVETTADVEELKIDLITKPIQCKQGATIGSHIVMHYSGYLLESNKEFDSSYKRGEPFDFTLGRGQVIQGWEKGVLGMCPGDKRKLTIPSALGYGSQGIPGVIPPSSALVFDIELMTIRDGSAQLEAPDEEVSPPKDHDDVGLEGNDFELLDRNGDKEISFEEMEVYLREGEEENSEDVDRVKTIVSEIFLEDDIDKNGALSLSEWSRNIGGTMAANEEGEMLEDIEDGAEEEEDEVTEEKPEHDEF